jgi:hypothetical protein
MKKPNIVPINASAVGIIRGGSNLRLVRGPTVSEADWRATNAFAR